MIGQYSIFIEYLKIVSTLATPTGLSVKNFKSSEILPHLQVKNSEWPISLDAG